MTTIIRQADANSLTDVSAQLRDAFTAARSAIDVGDPIVVIAHGADLLGQGTVEDAAVAGGLLGLVRALMFEGGRKGWHINLVAVDRGTEPTQDLLDAAVNVPALNGQVLNASSGHIGKVIP
jgi:hypothetical protein